MSTDLPAPAPESLAPLALAITPSVFDLFKVGPGPSSSHTIGPMRAAYDFLQRAQDLSDADRAPTVAVQVHLFGSLSATGRGHGTDRAVVAGLLGWLPDTCHPARPGPECHRVLITRAALPGKTRREVGTAPYLRRE